MDKEIEDKKKKLRKQLKDAGYNVYVFSSFNGVNWDNSQSKNFILAFVDKRDNSIMQLNPIYLKNLGFDTHYKKEQADRGLFYDGVLGMSRAFNIVYNLSSWLFKGTKEEKENRNKDAGYVLNRR